MQPGAPTFFLRCVRRILTKEFSDLRSGIRASAVDRDLTSLSRQPLPNLSYEVVISKAQTIRLKIRSIIRAV